MRKGKKPRRLFIGDRWWGAHIDRRIYRTAYECGCGWRCQRNGGGYERVIACPVCKSPKTMLAVAGYKS